MSKGEETRERILAQAARIFNRQGYSGSSLSDIMHETGLEKGGIYNHFASKEQLALAAFDYAIRVLDQHLRLALAGKSNAVDRLLAILSYFQSFAEEDPPIVGGCPILNTAIEADDAHPILRDRARGAMDDLRSSVTRIVIKGIARQEIRPEVNAETFATIVIATLEGALMLSKLYQDPVHMQRAVQHMTNYILAVQLA